MSPPPGEHFTCCGGRGGWEGREGMKGAGHCYLYQRGRFLCMNVGWGLLSVVVVGRTALYGGVCVCVYVCMCVCACVVLVKPYIFYFPNTHTCL